MNIELLLAVMVVVYTTGVIFRRLKLPILLGELIAGLVFGPALLGVLHDDQTIKILAELGVFFLLLHAGLETEPKDLLGSSKKALIVGLSSFLVPFLLGYFISLWFGFALGQALFVGLGISITSITVSVKLFKSFKINHTRTAHIVMGAAIVQEILAFIFFTVILAFANGEEFSWGLLGIVLFKTFLFFAITIFLGDKILPYARVLFNKKEAKGFTFTLLVALLFGLIAEKIGLHFVLGAFLAGIFVKEEIGENKELYEKIEDRIFALSYSFLGPIFFVSLGFNVSLDVLHGDAKTIWFLIMIIAAAVIGKIVTGALAHYSLNKKAGKRQALITGISMNGRGAVDLIIASIGLEAGIIGTETFSVLVLMAFFATLATTLLLKWILQQENQNLVEEARVE